MLATSTQAPPRTWRMPDPEWRRARTRRSEAYLDTLAFTVAAGDLGGLTKRSSWPACDHEGRCSAPGRLRVAFLPLTVHGGGWDDDHGPVCDV
jgi:hypothetical protein